MATQPQAEVALKAWDGLPVATKTRTPTRPKAAPSRKAREAPEPPPAWRVATNRINGSLLRRGAAARQPWDYRPVPPLALDEEGYLIADARPMNDRHLVRMLAYAQALKDRYEGRGGMVGADLSMPYVQGSPDSVVRPDLFVALAAEERQGREGRDSYKLWREPVPDFVLEDLSPSNWSNDAVDKRELYQRLGVREYWMLDETRARLRDDSDKRLREPLVGYRLRRGRYARIRPNAAGRLTSAVLNLELTVRDGLLRFFDPATGEYLKTAKEERTQRLAAERLAATERQEREAAEKLAAAERREREAAVRRATVEKREKEAAERQAATERREKEAAKRRAATERREKEAAQARIAELEAKLRAQRSD